MWKSRGLALFLTLAMLLTLPMSAFADNSDTAPSMEVQFEKDRYDAGEVVTAEVYVKNATFNAAGFSLKYDTDVMTVVSEDGVESDKPGLIRIENKYNEAEDTGYFLALSRTVDSTSGTLASLFYVKEKIGGNVAVADANGLLVASISFKMKQTAKPAVEFATIDGSADFSKETFKILNEGVQDENATAFVVYLQHVEDKPVNPPQESLVAQFVTRLYKVCLNREPDETGKADWVNRLESKEITGVQAASGFVFSDEFKNKNLCNEDYVEQLYEAFMGRASDPTGKHYWLDNLAGGMTREEVFNGFALSVEFSELCADYGIVQGEGIGIPQYGTVPTGSCSVCGKEDGVTAFVTRLYKVCLNREPDAAGLKDWTTQLRNHTATGKQVASGFIFSEEFKNRNLSNEDYVEYLYEAFMGRASDPVGKADWVGRLDDGFTREFVFEGFAGSEEFNNICNSYGILRD